MFTLAHLSDPHLAPMPTARMTELSGKRFTGYLNWQRKRRYVHDPKTLGRIVAHLKATATDHVAITGDFANISLPGEFDHMREWLSTLGPDSDLTTIPGNHDVYVQGALDMVQRAGGGTMQGDDGVKAFPFVRRRDPVAIVALNTGVPTRPLMATGTLGERQLASLAGILSGLKRENLFRVVLIHHPPISETARHKRLTDAAGFMKVIAAQGAELILHGHDHVHALHWLLGPAGRVPAVGVPSASALPGMDKDSAAYNLYRIDGYAGGWRCEMESRGINAEGVVGTIKRTVLTA
jgi:3',5'-cyclic AMP phosphodiesterase CpdA